LGNHFLFNLNFKEFNLENIVREEYKDFYDEKNSFMEIIFLISFFEALCQYLGKIIERRSRKRSSKSQFYLRNISARFDKK